MATRIPIVLNAGKKQQLQSGDSISPSIIAGTALTVGSDTNVTLALGGTPTTSLLAASSITAGWTGVLSIARGGTNQGSALTTGDFSFMDGTRFSGGRLGSSGAAIISYVPTLSFGVNGTSMSSSTINGWDSDGTDAISSGGALKIRGGNAEASSTSVGGNTYIFGGTGDHPTGIDGKTILAYNSGIGIVGDVGVGKVPTLGTDGTGYLDIAGAIYGGALTAKALYMPIQIGN